MFRALQETLNSRVLDLNERAFKSGLEYHAI
jgi:hypothetical protein